MAIGTEVTQVSTEIPAAPHAGNSATERVGANIQTNSPPKESASQEKSHGLATADRRNRNQQLQPKEVPKKKPPFTLRLSGLFLLLTFEILILIAITVLWALTGSNNGFVDVPDTPSSIESSQNIHGALLWFYSLLWTFIPAFIVSMCGTLFATTVKALEDCQPTLELRKHANPDFKCKLPFWRKSTSTEEREKSTTKLTILLDYGNYWFPFDDTFHAFRNKHFLIGFGTIVKWSFTATGPLASAIISIANVYSSTSIKVVSNTFFNDWKNESSSQPAFDSASAILLNDGSPGPWTTNEFSVVPFFDPLNTPGNLTADTRTYAASLDCKAIDIESLLRVGNVTLQAEGNGNSTNFYFTDRGCSVYAWIIASPVSSLYSQTRFATCPLEAGQARLLFMAGDYDPFSSYMLGNFSLISCIPYFWNSTSRVTVVSGSVDPVHPAQQSGQVIDIVTNISSLERFWPEFWQTWMYDIPQYKIEDPTFLSDSDDFGSLAYKYATQSNGTIDFIQSVNTTFGVFFAAFATFSTYSPWADNLVSTGSLSKSVNRLFVVFFPTVIVTVVMATSFVITVFIAIYAYQNGNFLKKHLDLILGHAILLEKNVGVAEFVQAVRENSQKPGERDSDLVKYAEKSSNLTLWKCWVDEEGILHVEEPAQSSPNSTQLSRPKFYKRILCSIRGLWGK